MNHVEGNKQFMSFVSNHQLIKAVMKFAFLKIVVGPEKIIGNGVSVETKWNVHKFPVNTDLIGLIRVVLLWIVLL